MQRFPLFDIRIGLTSTAPQAFALAMLCGAIWYFSIPFEPDLRPLFGAASVVWTAAMIGFIRGFAPGLMALLVILSGAATGAVSGKLATERTQTIQMSEVIGPVLLEGWVMQAQPAKRGVRLVVRVHAIDGLAGPETPQQVRLTHIAQLKTDPGRFVRCWSVLRPPPAPILEGDYAFDRQAWYQGLGAVGYVQGRCRGGALGPPDAQPVEQSLRIAKARRSLARYVEKRAGDRAGGFAAALISGDRSFMPMADQDALRGSGLAHLLAISGLHMGLLGGLIYLILWRGLAFIEPLALRVSVKKPAAFGALLACAVYLVISGASISTQRAFIMAMVVFVGVLLDRSALSLRSLAIAMILVLILAPWSALTPGFQMSFAATGVLIASYEYWRRRNLQTGQSQRGISFWLKSLFVTSTVSSSATMPFAYFHFGRVAGLGIIANLAAMPVITLISAPMAAAALMLAPFGLDALALRAFGLSLEWVLAIAHGFAERRVTVPFTLSPMPGSALAALTGVLVSYCVLDRRRWRYAAMFGFCCAAFGLWAGASQARIHIAPSGEVFLETKAGRIERHAWREADGLAPLRFIDVDQTSNCLKANACALEFQGHTLEPVRLADLDLILVSSSPDHVAQIIDWPTVQDENGITLTWRNGRFVREEKPACGRRPWQSC
ncbi:MAG: ComEC/Rec2 family competence protein [Pseudomonadota bacterium]